MERYAHDANPHEDRKTDMQQSGTGYPPSTSHPVHSRTVYEFRPRRARKKPWYNQRWVWLIVAAIAMVVFWLALSALTDEASQINGSIKEQTGVLRDQNQWLASIRQSIGGLTHAVHDGFDRLIQAIMDATRGGTL